MNQLYMLSDFIPNTLEIYSLDRIFTICIAWFYYYKTFQGFLFIVLLKDVECK